MAQDIAEKAKNRLFFQLFMEIQQSHQKVMECCIQQSELSMEFLMALQRHTKALSLLANQFASLDCLKEDHPIENTSERRSNATAAIKRIFESKTLKICELGAILGISRPTTMRIIQEEIPPGDEVILRVEGFLQSFSVKELKQLFLLPPSENLQ